MDRNHYKIFSECCIAGLTISNRLIRSATWDPSILNSRQMTDEVMELYRNLALGGVGAIITGGFPVYRENFPEEDSGQPIRLYADLRVNGLEKMAETIHQARPDCKVIAQFEVGYLDAGPSSIPSPFSEGPTRELSLHEIEQIVVCFVDPITDIRASGFDGVQLHAAHGGLLSRFLSPYSNRREGDLGSTPENRAKIIREIVTRARKQVGDFPILIKMNCTDYLVGGVDIENFPALAQEVARAGVDAIELSGGMRRTCPRSIARRCHGDAAATYGQGVHSRARGAGRKLAAACVDCHGIHHIRASGDRASRTFPLKIPETCGRCHGTERVIDAASRNEGNVYAAFMASVHGKGLFKSGLLVSAECTDCHGAHDVRPMSDPESSIAKTKLPATCGRCHDGIEQVFLDSIHGRKLLAGDPKAPTCEDCHTAHRIRRAESVDWALEVLDECGACHEQSLTTVSRHVPRPGDEPRLHAGRDVRRVPRSARHQAGSGSGVWKSVRSKSGRAERRWWARTGTTWRSL